MAPLLLLVASALAGALFFYQLKAQKKALLKQCAFGDIHAYRLLCDVKSFEKLDAEFKQFRTPEQRAFYVTSISFYVEISVLEQWQKTHPDNPDAWLCLGAKLVRLAWDARGFGRGNEVSEDAWHECFRSLELARAALLNAARMQNDDPTPWALLILVATWKGESQEQKWAYFNEAAERDSLNWMAHMHMLIALSEKWSGNNDEMIQFAKDAVNKAPEGNILNCLLAKAYLEQWKYFLLFEDDPERAHAFVNSESVLRDIQQLYDKSLNSPIFSPSPIAIFARYNISAWFWLVRDKDRLKQEFTLLGDKIEAIHWTWTGLEDEFDQAKRFALEK